MRVNERLATFAGWKCLTDGIYRKYWKSPDRERDGVFPWPSPPEYDTSLDLIRRDLLPRLTYGQWEQLDSLLELQWESVLATPPHPDFSWARFILTLPPADLAAAIAEVVGA